MKTLRPNQKLREEKVGLRSRSSELKKKEQLYRKCDRTDSPTPNSNINIQGGNTKTAEDNDAMDVDGGQTFANTKSEDEIGNADDFQDSKESYGKKSSELSDKFDDDEEQEERHADYKREQRELAELERLEKETAKAASDAAKLTKATPDSNSRLKAQIPEKAAGNEKNIGAKSGS